MNAPWRRLLKLVQRQKVVGLPRPFGLSQERGRLLHERGARVDAEEARAVAQAATAPAWAVGQALPWAATAAAARATASASPR